MKLLKAVPEAAVSIENGSLNLSTVSAVQTFFKREEKELGKTYSQAQKRELLHTIENKSKREVEKILMTLSPDSSVPAEKERKVTLTLTELRIILSEDGMRNLEKAKALLSHQTDGSNGKVIERLIEIALEKMDPVKKEERAQRRAQAKQGRQENQEKQEKISPPADKKDTTNEVTEKPSGVSSCKSSERRKVTPRIRRLVLLRDGYQCTYKDPLTGRRCYSKRYLEVDHLQPVSLGGTSDMKSLRTLCRSHNQWEAIRLLGRHKMAPYLNIDT
jgi:hypothetical protein